MDDVKKYDLYVYLNSDGTIISLDKHKRIHHTFTDLNSWKIIHTILEYMDNPKKKFLDIELRLYSVKFYFRTIDETTGEYKELELDVSHINYLAKSIIK